MPRYEFREQLAGAPSSVRVLVSGPGRTYSDAGTDQSRPSMITDDTGTLRFWADTLGTYTAKWDGGSASLEVTGTPGQAGLPSAVGDQFSVLWTNLNGAGSTAAPIDLPDTTPARTGGSVSYAPAEGDNERDQFARFNEGGLYVATGLVRGTVASALLNVGGTDRALSASDAERQVTFRAEPGDTASLRLSLASSAAATVSVVIDRVA